MIKVKNGRVQMKGSIVKVSAEFTMAANTLIKCMLASGMTKEEIKEKLDYAYSLAFLSKEELAEKKKEILEDMKNEGVEADE